KEPTDDDAPRVPRDHRRRGSLPVGGSAPGAGPHAARLLDPRLPSVGLAPGARLRGRARLRRCRAARAPNADGPHPGAGVRAGARLIESHGDFTDSPALLEILQRTDSPGAGLLWDAHHTFVSGKEAPEDTVRQVGRYIRHTHLKDSVPMGNDRRYVLTGTGEV